MKNNATKQEYKTVKLIKELVAKKVLDEHHLLMVSNELEHIFEQGKKEGAKECSKLIENACKLISMATKEIEKAAEAVQI